VVRELDIGNTIIKGTRTSRNLHILKGGQEQCYLGKARENWLWHRRLGHLSFFQISKSGRLEDVRDLPNITLPKSIRVQLNAKEGLESKPPELIHIDLCGLVKKKSPHGEQYYILFIDDFSRMC